MSTPSLINDRYFGFDSSGLPPVVPNLAGRVKRGSSHGPAQAPRPNPHSPRLPIPRGTVALKLPAISCLGAFRTPAAVPGG
jgi:hypothetical protein